MNLLKILLKNAEGHYQPESEPEGKMTVFLQFLKFALVGLSNTLILLLLYYIVLWMFGVGYYLIGQTAGYFLGILNSYYWNHKYVFHSKNKWSVVESLKMVSFYLMTYFIQTGLLILFVQYFKLSVVFAPIFAVIITTPVNYFLNRTFTFSKQGE